MLLSRRVRMGADDWWNLLVPTQNWAVDQVITVTTDVCLLDQCSI